MAEPEKNTERNQTVAEVALEYPQAIKFLQHYKIDYCCKGHRNFAAACRQANLDPEILWRKIKSELPLPGKIHPMDFQHWDTPLLIDHILQHHHQNVRISIPRISMLLRQFGEEYSETVPDVSEAEQIFNVLSAELIGQITREEDYLFPVMKRAFRHSAAEETILPNLFDCIRTVEQNHINTLEWIKLIRDITDNIAVRPGLKPAFIITARMLEDFESDLMQHAHLENNILFAKLKSQRLIAAP